MAQNQIIGSTQNNLIAAKQLVKDKPNAIGIIFQAQNSAEPVGFKVLTNSKIKETLWQYPSLKGTHTLSISEYISEYEYGINLENYSIQPHEKFIIVLIFENADNPQDSVIEITAWDGKDGNKSLKTVDFN